jgi:hypothetical protein
MLYSNLAGRERLALHLHSLAALDIDDEYLVYGLVPHLAIGLNIPKAGSAQRIVRHVANYRERQAAICAPQ